MAKATKCTIGECSGKVFVKYNHTRPNGDKIRKRECDTCKKVTWTTEVPRDKYQRMKKLTACIQNGVKEYVKG